MRKKGINPVDKHVGGRVRMRRMMLDRSQEWLGAQLDLTFQQVQKYEKGVNRISASTLQTIASVLGVPVAFFFEGAPGEAAAKGAAAKSDLATRFFGQAYATELAENFVGLDSTTHRRVIADVARALAGNAVASQQAAE